ncbi:hypothetical protein [Deinococcus sp. UR1]|uniref:hypothetical protein n=1 Tax=Deinococcus sp. UR1 TaxID=1704277 RepID=UPI0018EE08F9|nr:hypothetical protein [Deinococcus sp. UR1]
MPQPRKTLTPTFPTILAILTAADLGRSPDLKPNTFARYASLLRNAGLIERTAGNKHYRLTEQGARIYPKLQRIAAEVKRLDGEASVLLAPLLMDGQA